MADRFLKIWYLPECDFNKEITNECFEELSISKVQEVAEKLKHKHHSVIDNTHYKGQEIPLHSFEPKMSTNLKFDYLVIDGHMISADTKGTCTSIFVGLLEYICVKIGESRFIDLFGTYLKVSENSDELRSSAKISGTLFIEKHLSNLDKLIRIKQVLVTLNLLDKSNIKIR